MRTETITGFACSCGDAKKQEMGFLKTWVIAQLGGKEWYEKYSDYLLTTIITDLNVRYGVEITGIPTDPGGWSAIKTESICLSPKFYKEPNVSSWVECDRIEDGIYLTYKLYAERFPNGNIKMEED